MGEGAVTRPVAVFFDFDGVVLESVDVKTRAFAALFEDRPEHVAAIIDLHRRHGGISRVRKIEMIHADILGEPLDRATRDALADRFGILVAEGVRRCPLVPGAEAALRRLSRDVPLFVVSGTPEAELRDVVAARELGGYFAGVFGSPREKPEILADVRGRFGWEARDCVFVGDAMTDFDAAMADGMPFIGRVPEGGENPFPTSVPVIGDLRGIADLRALRGIAQGPRP